MISARAKGRRRIHQTGMRAGGTRSALERQDRSSRHKRHHHLLDNTTITIQKNERTLPQGASARCLCRKLLFVIFGEVDKRHVAFLDEASWKAKAARRS